MAFPECSTVKVRGALSCCWVQLVGRDAVPATLSHWVSSCVPSHVALLSLLLMGCEAAVGIGV